MAELKIRKLSEIQPEPVKWLWQPYIPSGKITLIQGDGSIGKTTVSLAIAAAVSTGTPLPGEYGSGYTEPACVIVQNAEDGLADTIRPRLENFGADCDMIHNIDDDDEALSFTDERIEQTIIQTKARVCILDPVQAYFRGVNMNSANAVRPIMKHLATVAERHDCAIVLVGHLNKQGGKSAYRGLGSIDVFAAARSVLTVGGTPANENFRVVVQNKNNLAPAGKPQSFELDAVYGFNWRGDYDITIDEVMNGKPKTETQLAKARRLIENALRNGVVLAVEMEELAEENGISQKTFNRAKTELGVISVKRGGQWYWDMPIEVVYTDFTDVQDSQNNQHGQDSRRGNG